MANKIKRVKIGCLTQFPFLDASFDAVTQWEILQKLGEKTNEVITFVNDLLEDKLTEFIEEKFNDMMLNAMYEEDTETLVLYLSNDE